MKRTTISLPDDLALELERQARRREMSASEVVREALRKYLGPEDGQRRRRISFAGVGDSGRTDIARNLEDYLEREGFPDRGR